MPFRIADLAHGQRLTSTLAAIQARTREAQMAIASGKAARRFDQIADDAGLLLRARDARTLAGAFLDRNQTLARRLQAMDSALDGLVGIAQRARATLVRRLDSGTGRNMPLTAEIDGMLAEIAARLNTKLGEDHLFAGSRTDQPPVALPAGAIAVADPSLYYRGDEVRLSARVDEGVEITYGVTASDPAFAGLIAALGQARIAHAADDRAGLEQAMAGLDAALGGIIDLRGSLGAEAARLDPIRDAHEAGIAYLDDIVSGIEDADVPAVMTRLAQDQATLEAAYAVTGRLAALSLADYLQ